ncbi:hypothetical protein [Hydrogenovibrio sp. SC-1]|uniref:hypothetical protein n=1 Tax=Hydrogenovibrio sp. SC-1 TaxID=2065820 RepID=UPI00117B1E7C|nr:hypothetical protein [Hydrogenovibrio sp. SC-1]
MNNKQQQFTHLYRDISANISSAVHDLSEIKLEHQEGNQQLIEMQNLLNSMQKRFNEELVFLEENSEWDVFSVAFFGETNAGKSTLIESLRILFNENERQKLIDANAQDVKVIEESLTDQVETLRQHIAEMVSHHASEVEKITGLVAEIKERSEHEASLRLRRHVLMAGIGGIVAGVGVMSVIQLFMVS